MYTIKEDELSRLSCSCPAWRFNHSGDRTCKHIRYYLSHKTERRFDVLDVEVEEIKARTPKNVKVESRWNVLDMDGDDT
jgi:predicted nucleic acid-binding Zn finger protein